MSALEELSLEVEGKGVTIVAISKTKPLDKIMEVHAEGHLDFGENKVQDLVSKYEELPKDIRWHFVGHLQRNKVKYLAPFVHLIHAVDSLRLAREINKQGEKSGRKISVLIQSHIADEDSKFGVPMESLESFLNELDQEGFGFVEVKGLMGMATNTIDQEKVKAEFRALYSQFEKFSNMEWQSDINMKVLSMGMTNDYPLAVECGSNMIRIGTKIFGPREQ